MTPTEQTQPSSPAPIVKNVTKKVFDLDSFDELELVKSITVVPVASYPEFLARMNNDTAAVVNLLNVALVEQEKKAARSSETGWHTYKEDENGELTSEVNGEYSGTPANLKTVQALTLTLAKTIFGYAKGLSKDAKKAAKEKAANMIKANDEMKAGLRANMATASAEEED